MARGSMDMLFLDFSMVHYIMVLVHFSMYQASVQSLSAVECLVYATLKAHHIFLLIIILSSSLAKVNVSGVWFFCYIYNVGGQQIICSSDIIIAVYLSIASGCDHYRNNRLDLVFVPQFTVKQNLLVLFLDPRWFPSLLTAN